MRALGARVRAFSRKRISRRRSFSSSSLAYLGVAPRRQAAMLGPHCGHAAALGRAALPASGLRPGGSAAAARDVSRTTQRSSSVW